MSLLEHATLNEALRLAKELGARRYEATFLGNLGVHHHSAGRLRRAEELYRESRSLAREIGLLHIDYIMLGNIGDALRDQGDLHQAEITLREAVQSSRAHESVRPWAGQIKDLAKVLMGLGRLDEAREALEESRALAFELGNPMQIGEVVVCFARLHRLEGDLLAAVEALDEGERVLKDVPEEHCALRARIERMELHLAHSSPASVLEIADVVEPAIRRLHAPLLLADHLAVRARAERLLDDPRAETTTSELADVLDALELVPEAPLRRVLAELKARR